MQMTQRQWVIAGGGFVMVCIVVGMLRLYRTTPVETPPTPTPATASSTGTTFINKVTPPIPVRSGPFPINPADTITSWSFKGAYSGNDILITQAQTDIAHLTALVGKGEYDDYDLHLGIGNDKSMLGDGAGAYEEYNRSIKIHPQKGLAFVNLAHLMNGLGAYRTAADAYTKAVTVEPRVLEYHVERLTYLTQQFKADNALIEAAFANATKQFGEAVPLLSIEAQWLTEEERYAEALSVWEKVKTLSFGKDTAAIDNEIVRLQSKI